MQGVHVRESFLTQSSKEIAWEFRMQIVHIEHKEYA
jgi:hypothetical protein